MRIAEVVGTVTLSRQHSSFAGATLRLVIPYSPEALKLDSAHTNDSVVVWDQLGAGIGSCIALSEGAEAAQPFRPEFKPVDAYNAAILDEIDKSGDESHRH